MSNPSTQEAISRACREIEAVLLAKNESYGDSALNPVRIFSRANPIEQINVRIDDKLSRLARGNNSQDEDTELDLIGYLILRRITNKKDPPAVETGQIPHNPSQHQTQTNT